MAGMAIFIWNAHTNWWSKLTIIDLATVPFGRPGHAFFKGSTGSLITAPSQTPQRFEKSHLVCLLTDRFNIAMLADILLATSQPFLDYRTKAAVVQTDELGTIEFNRLLLF